ncbi:hypothetical protein XU18_3692 [Perkinsela sp. CCAP 1560/4]|nr:hypothetical protein XU18_3692 [Perkinsela sp. CCAP 1560/4]|eukprot:KNH05288.1 hypothetical protein XU18_3692 [Perkinsela sp. CCAP 1560/4]
MDHTKTVSHRGPYNHKMLSKYSGHRVHVRCGERVLIGTLASVDNSGNLLLLDAEEDITGLKVQTLRSSQKDGLQGNHVTTGAYFKQHGMILIRGSSVCTVAVDHVDVISSKVNTQYGALPVQTL